jgi:hypothetical protein
MRWHADPPGTTLHNLKALDGAWIERQRFLDQYMLAGVQGTLRELDVRIRVRANAHGMNFGIGKNAAEIRGHVSDRRTHAVRSAVGVLI